MMSASDLGSKRDVDGIKEQNERFFPEAIPTRIHRVQAGVITENTMGRQTEFVGRTMTHEAACCAR